MSRFSHYGSGQRLAFAMMFAGFCLCLVGAVVPFWMKSEINLADISSGIEKDIPFVGKILHNLMEEYHVVKFNVGVWVVCIETVGSETQCYKMYSSDTENDLQSKLPVEDTDNSWIHVVRIAVSINLLLSLICGLTACCRCMCCSGGRTICHGIFAFISGGCGIFAFAIVAAHKNDMLPVSPVLRGLIVLDNDWAFYMYAIGSGLMIVASLFLCFSIPRETPGAMVMMPMPGAAPYLTVNSVNTNQNMVHAPANQYELNGQISSFEPLPGEPTFGQPPPAY